MRFFRRTYLFLILISVIVLLFAQKNNIKALYHKLPANHISIDQHKTDDSLKMSLSDDQKTDSENIVQSLGDWSSDEATDPENENFKKQTDRLNENVISSSY